MNTFTPNYGLYLTAPQEFVDVNQQLNSNLTIIDNATDVIRGQTFSVPFLSSPPQVQLGARALSSFDSDYRYWKGPGWATCGISNGQWQPITSFVSGFAAADSTKPPSFRILPADDLVNKAPGTYDCMVEFRGYAALPGFGRILAGNIDVFDAASLIAPFNGQAILATATGWKSGVVGNPVNMCYWNYGHAGTLMSFLSYDQSFPNGDTRNLVNFHDLKYSGRVILA